MLTQDSAPGAWGLFPIPFSVANVTYREVTPLPELLAIAPGATEEALSHCCFRTLFTGPANYSGLGVLAVQTGTDIPAILGGIGTVLTAEICNNGIDDDGDGLVDRNDPECQVCGNGFVDPAEACDDGNRQSGDGCSAFCVLDNLRPTAACKDVQVPVDASCQACASVDDGSSGSHGSTWTISESPGCPYSPGTTAVTLTITDSFGLSSSCTGNVTAYDATAPTINLGPQKVLWPPEHDLRTLRLSDLVASVIDNCSSQLDINIAGTILSIYSDEPEDEVEDGDGQTNGDIVIVDHSTFQLRAERGGTGNGRVCGVRFSVTDSAGNVAEALVKVHVPHDPAVRHTAVDDGAEAGYTLP